MAAKNKFLNAMKMPSIDDMFSSEADRQQEDIRVQQQPAAQNDLLLVAAGQVADLCLGARRLGVHGVDHLLGVLGLKTNCPFGKVRTLLFSQLT